MSKYFNDTTSVQKDAGVLLFDLNANLQYGPKLPKLIEELKAPGTIAENFELVARLPELGRPRLVLHTRCRLQDHDSNNSIFLAVNSSGGDKFESKQFR